MACNADSGQSLLTSTPALPRGSLSDLKRPDPSEGCTHNRTIALRNQCIAESEQSAKRNGDLNCDLLDGKLRTDRDRRNASTSFPEASFLPLTGHLLFFRIFSAHIVSGAGKARKQKRLG